jgi:primosomal replication protein N
LNKTCIEGALAEIGSLRYTPAGIPMLNFQLMHESQQFEANSLRKTSVLLNAIAAGPVAVQLDKELKQSTGQSGVPRIEAVGFLAAKKLGSQSVVLHLTEFKLTFSKEDHAI